MILFSHFFEQYESLMLISLSFCFVYGGICCQDNDKKNQGNL